MRTRPNTPRTGRPRKIRMKRKGRIAGKRNPKQLSAAIGRNRKRRRKKK